MASFLLRSLYMASLDAECGGRAPIGLRPLVGGMATLLSLLAVATCLALIVLTTVLRHQTERSEAAAQGVRLAESVRVRLLLFGRSSDLALLYRDPPHELARHEAEADLLGRMSDVRAQELSSGHRELLDHTEQSVRQYLLARHGAESEKATLQDVLGRASAPLAAALAATGQLVDGEMGNVRLAQRRAETFGRVANVIGIAFTVVFLGAFGGALVGLRHLLYGPINSLHGAIVAFVEGEKASRAPEKGVAELCSTAHVFNEMADRLAREELDRLTFIAGVAHDLRNPLAALRLATRVLDPEQALPEESRLRETLALVGRQVIRLERMVGDLLDASRIEAGHLELREETRDLRAVVEDVVRLYQKSSIAHSIAVAVPDEPVTVRCDPTRLEQVLNNLVSNAIKYSPAGGPVDVKVWGQGGEALVSVTDQGLGIATEDLPHIFEPFRRAGASRETIPGVGLGLSVSRKLVEAHDGRIEVESRLGVGSTFVVHLPLAAVAAGADARTSSEPQGRETPLPH